MEQAYKLPSITVFLIQRGYNKLDGTGLQTFQYQSMFSSERTQQVWSNSTGLQTLQYQSMFI